MEPAGQIDVGRSLPFQGRGGRGDLDRTLNAVGLAKGFGGPVELASTPLRYQALPWAALTAVDRAAWRLIRSRRSQLASPFFSLGWHDAIESARGGVEVIKISRGARAVGFLPFCRSLFGSLHPVGAPMADWHGLIGPAGSRIEMDDLLKAARARSYRFSGAPVDDPVLQCAGSAAASSLVMDLADGYAAYEVEARNGHPKAFRNLRARERRLHERCVEIRLDDRDPVSLAKVLSMKSGQYRRTRQIDIFSFGWTRNLIKILFAEEQLNEPEQIRGLLSTLWVDGSLAAGHFGIKDCSTLHYWFPVYDARFADFSPGILLLHEMARAAKHLEFSRIDLGDGDYRFKQEFANRRIPLVSGIARLKGKNRGTRPQSSPGPVMKPAALTGGIGRISRGLSRRLDTLSTLYRWSHNAYPAAE